LANFVIIDLNYKQGGTAVDTHEKPNAKRFRFSEERKQIIMEILNDKKRIVVPELCKLFNTSPATIRNDLNELQEAGLLKRTHGGAILNKQVSYENSFIKEVEHLAEKQAIAKQAIRLINDGDTIVIDTGTTTMELAKLLHTKNRLTIVVNDITIAAELERTCEASIVFIGGYVRRGLHCTVGPLAHIALRDLNVDKAFIATNGLTIEGLSTPDMYQADIKKMMLEIADHTIILADSSKFGNTAFKLFARLEDFDTLITDDAADANTLNRFREHGINVETVSVK
jgi:DeoR family fructose operon transcriptional repressor